MLSFVTSALFHPARTAPVDFGRSGNFPSVGDRCFWVTAVVPAVPAGPVLPPIRVNRRRAIRWFALLALVIVEIALVAPHFADSGAALDHVKWGWVAAAVACEVASIATFARLRRSLLRAGGLPVPQRQMGALTLASNAIAVSAPAGLAVSAGYLYRQLRRLGASAPLITWTLAAGAVVSTATFSVITLAGAVLAGDTSVGAVAGTTGLSLLAVLGLIALLTVVTHHPRPLLHGLRSMCRRLPGRRAKSCPESDEKALDRVVDQITAITPRLRDWSAAFLFSLLNWVADLACFVLCCYAVGVTQLGLGAAVLAYVAGLATTSISLLPAGLGSLEAGMLLGLTHGGVAAPVAVAGIVIYRLVSYALVAAVGWVVWAALRRRFAGQYRSPATAD
jgi:putative heme transporter